MLTWTVHNYLTTFRNKSKNSIEKSIKPIIIPISIGYNYEEYIILNIRNNRSITIRIDEDNREEDYKKIIKFYKKCNNFESLPLKLKLDEQGRPTAIHIRRGRHEKMIAEVRYIKSGVGYHTTY